MSSPMGTKNVTLLEEVHPFKLGPGASAILVPELTVNPSSHSPSLRSIAHAELYHES
jgi:hypothetical protein